MKARLVAWLPPLLPLLLLVSIGEFLTRNNFVPSYLLPAPSSVLAATLADGPEILQATASTGYCAFVGLGLSFGLGLFLALVLSTSIWLRRAIYPYATFFQTVPIIAVAPLLVIWFGFGHPTVIAAAFIVSVFPIIASSLLGLNSTDPSLIDLFRLYGANPMQILFKLRLPFASPQIFSGLRIAAGLSVIGAIVGEFIAGGGLGAIIDEARTQQRLDKVFAAILFSTLLGIAFIGAINLLSWSALRRWHASEIKKN